MPIEETHIVTGITSRQWDKFCRVIQLAARSGGNVPAGGFSGIKNISGGKQFIIEFTKNSAQYGRYTISYIGNRVTIVGTGYVSGIATWMAGVMKSAPSVMSMFSHSLNIFRGLFLIVIPLPVLEEGMKGMPGYRGGKSPMT